MAMLSMLVIMILKTVISKMMFEMLAMVVLMSEFDEMLMMSMILPVMVTTL
jgi:hypothetical protein